MRDALALVKNVELLEVAFHEVGGREPPARK